MQVKIFLAQAKSALKEKDFAKAMGFLEQANKLAPDKEGE